jgi:Glycosyltransferase family 87
VFAFPNDYAIFRASFWNLLSNRDLYILRLDQARDYFKYSPSFALLFAPFAVLPFVLGLFFWNALNALAIFFSLRILLPREQWATAQILIALPALRSLQSSQSNALVAALIIVAFVCLERGSLWRGGLAIAVGTIIKIFPAVAIIFALPTKDRVRAITVTVLCVVVLIALPLLVIPPSALAAQYQSWAALERREAILVGSSAMGLLRDAGIIWPVWALQLAGFAIVLGVLLLRQRDWSDRNLRMKFLGFVLLFCVVFNHRAERQSAVIAVVGMVIWYLASPRQAWRTALFVLVYLLVSVIGSDLVPAAIKDPLSAAIRFTVPLTVFWLAMLGDLINGWRNRLQLAEAG